MASYLKKEISEWNTTDLCNWLLANKFRGISELFQKYYISGYDLFYIDDEVLKNELNLKSFHERKVALKLIKKLTYEHLKLNIINSNGDNVILTLDNNPETKLGEISEYIGNMFNIEPKDILFKDSTKQEVLSPTVKIVPLLILYPKIYKTLNVSNMKDYRQVEEEMMDSGSGEYAENNEMNNNMDINNNYKKKEIISIGSGMMGSDDYKEMDNNNKYNFKMKNNNNNKNYRPNDKVNNKKLRENDNQNNLRDKNNDNKEYKYNNNHIKMNNNVRQIDNSNDNFLLSGLGENMEEANKMNGKNKNMEYNNDYNYNDRRKNNYKINEEDNNDIMEYNPESNFGLLSSANDDEMKFKPSYQIKNNDNNNKF